MKTQNKTLLAISALTVLFSTPSVADASNHVVNQVAVNLDVSIQDYLDTVKQGEVVPSESTASYVSTSQVKWTL